MHIRLPFLLLTACALAVTLPFAKVESQLAPPAGDPMSELQAIQMVNDDLLKRQDATLKDLADITDQAREVRIFSKRG